ncbi:leucine-rich repeat-containing protein 37A2-like [Cavia porcellus]|uniref:leucine-rich repeat-containing protein 37A2-like n=1 Tax=Cavia porcellus TaxID=10141 RepID=UPI002FE36CE7
MFLKFINLRCNLLIELDFGTFQTWHGMQFLHHIILNHNPLSAIEDSSLFQLPGLKYLDLGQTHFPLISLENIITMALGLKTLILPSNMVCCLCQFKNDIEVVGKTVKLHCDRTCVVNTTLCVGQATIGNLEEALMKGLQARNMNTNTMLTIKPEKASAKKSGLHLSGLVKKQLDTNDENDITHTASFTLPYFLEGNLEDIEKTILPFIHLLFSNTQNGNNPLAYLENSTRNSSAQLASGNLSLKDKLKTLQFLQKLLNAKIQEILDDTKKKEKTATLMPSRTLDPQFRHQIFANKLESPETQENSLAEVEGERKMFPSSKTLLKELKHPQQSVFKEERKQKAGVKGATQPFLEDVTKEGSLRRSIPQEVGQHQRMPRPRKFVENSLRIEPSFTDEQKVTASSFLKHPSMDRSPSSIPAKALPKVRKRTNVFNYILDLQNANARVKTTEGTKPVLHPGNPHHFPKTHSLVVRGTREVKLSDKLRKKNTRSKLPLVKRPQFSAVRTLISFPSGRFFSSSGEPSFQETPVSELYAPSELSVESTPVENHTAADTSKGADFALGISVPEETISKDTTHKNHSAAYSAVTAFNLIPAVNHSTKALWEHPNMGTDSPLKDFTSLSLSSSRDQFEIYVNQQLWSLIPNNDIRRLISRVIRSLKMDCSETHVQVACAKLISKTGLLMKLFSEQQKAKVSKAQRDTEHGKNENYIIESAEDQNEEKEQQSRELKVEVPGYGYKNKLILTVSVTGVAIILLIIFCLIEIYSQKRASEENEEESSRGFSQRWHGRYKMEQEKEKAVSGVVCPLWLKDMYRPISASHMKQVSAKLHGKDSSDEGEIFTKHAGEVHGVTTEAAPTASAIKDKKRGLKKAPVE